MRKQAITSDPRILLGKPTVTGTRITVEHVLERLGAGETIEDILQSHPRLTREGIQAALTYAADVLKNDVVYPVGESAA